MFQDLALRLGAGQRNAIPVPDKWFRALSETRLSAGRAVIIGQDPYPDPELADGLAFSVPDGGPRLPPSLARILNEARLVAAIAPGRTSLLPWRRRGFIGSNPLGRVNERLSELAACPIDWSLD